MSTAISTRWRRRGRIFGGRGLLGKGRPTAAADERYERLITPAEMHRLRLVR
ncbi:hypothetical protein [Gordonia sp. VNK21]|uniref:hypothetical protein n=1 Tax=Gordonia sp. VNK21 TaxID=3382483 RepID=UPI0038D3CF5B